MAERGCRTESKCNGGRDKSFLLMNENVPGAREDAFIETPLEDEEQQP